MQTAQTRTIIEINLVVIHLYDERIEPYYLIRNMIQHNLYK